MKHWSRIGHQVRARLEDTKAVLEDHLGPGPRKDVFVIHNNASSSKAFALGLCNFDKHVKMLHVDELLDPDFECREDSLFFLVADFYHPSGWDYKLSLCEEMLLENVTFVCMAGLCA